MIETDVAIAATGTGGSVLAVVQFFARRMIAKYDARLDHQAGRITKLEKTNAELDKNLALLAQRTDDALAAIKSDLDEIKANTSSTQSDVAELKLAFAKKGA